MREEGGSGDSYVPGGGVREEGELRDGVPGDEVELVALYIQMHCRCPFHNLLRFSSLVQSESHSPVEFNCCMYIQMYIYMYMYIVDALFIICFSFILILSYFHSRVSGTWCQSKWTTYVASLSVWQNWNRTTGNIHMWNRTEPRNKERYTICIMCIIYTFTWKNMCIAH